MSLSKRQNELVPSPDDIARIAARYPKRRRSTPLIVGVAALLTVLGLVWMVWAGLDYANPKLAAMVESFEIASDDEVTATLRVQRDTPEVAGTCLIIAQAVSYQRVGELTIEVPPSTEALTEQKISIKTVQRATSVSVASCTAS